MDTGSWAAGRGTHLFHLWEGTLCGTPIAEPLVTGEASGLHGWHFSHKRWAFLTGSSRRKQEGSLDSAQGSPCPVTCFGENMSISLKVLEGNWLQRQPRSMSCEKVMEMGNVVVWAEEWITAWGEVYGRMQSNTA